MRDWSFMDSYAQKFQHKFFVIGLLLVYFKCRVKLCYNYCSKSYERKGYCMLKLIIIHLLYVLIC